MKKAILFICLLIACAAVVTSCSNEAKKKYEQQKAYVEALQESNHKVFLNAAINESKTSYLIEKLQCYDNEIAALDSLKNLALKAYGEKSVEYLEAKRQLSDAKAKETETMAQGMESVTDFLSRD